MHDLGNKRSRLVSFAARLKSNERSQTKSDEDKHPTSIFSFYANIHRPFVKGICYRTLARLMCVIYCP